jgi:hypothetical protein
VEAAITELAGLSVNEAAKRLGWAQSTLNSIINKGVQRCRAKRRLAIAALVGLPDEEMLEPGTYWPVSSDRLIRVVDVTDLERLGLPPRGEFAMYRVGNKIAKAWNRDRNRGSAPPHHPYPQADWHEFGDESEQYQHFYQMFIPKLFSLWGWRFALIEPEDVGLKVPSEEADSFGVSIATAVETLLTPWFNDEAALDYEKFYQMWYWLGGLSPPLTPLPDLPRQTRKTKRARRKNA